MLAVGDLDRQAAVERATDGCLVAVGLLSLAAITSIALALPSTISILLAVLLILSGLVLGVMEWAERG